MSLQPALSIADLEREGLTTGFFEIDPAEPVSTADGVIDFQTDEDYFLFSPFPNTRYRLSVDADFDAELGLYALADLDRLARDDDGGPGRNPEIVFDAGDAPEAFILQVDEFGNGEPGGAIRAGGGTFTLSIADEGQSSPLPAPGTDVVGASLATAGSLAPGEPALGAIDFGGDLDRYIVFLEKGHSYRFDLVANSEAGGAGLDPFLELLGPGGGTLASRDGGADGDVSLTFKPQQTGLFSVVAQDFDLDFGTGGYDLTFVETARAPTAGVDRVSDVLSGAPLIEADRPVLERIDSRGDFDVFEIAVQEGTTYRLDVIGFGGLDTTLALRDQDGTRLAFNDDSRGTRDSEITFTARDTGFLFAEVGGFGASQGDYDLLFEPVVSPEATTLEARAIALLYEAGLGRPAAFTGLNFWIDKFETGDSLVRISQAFLDSFEFASTVGDPDRLSDAAFIDGLSINVLGRFLADEGFEFWTGRLADGASRAQTLLAFATVRENAAQSPEVDTLGQVGQLDGLDLALQRNPNPFEEWDFGAA